MSDVLVETVSNLYVPDAVWTNMSLTEKMDANEEATRYNILNWIGCDVSDAAYADENEPAVSFVAK